MIYWSGPRLPPDAPVCGAKGSLELWPCDCSLQSERKNGEHFMQCQILWLIINVFWSSSFINICISSKLWPLCQLQNTKDAIIADPCFGHFKPRRRKSQRTLVSFCFVQTLTPSLSLQVASFKLPKQLCQPNFTHRDVHTSFNLDNKVSVIIYNK